MSKKIKKINVILGLTLHGNKVLLTRRNDVDIPDIHGKWEIPGGKPEASEKSEETAVREVFEETGYQVKATDKIIPFLYIVERKLENLVLEVTVSCVICKAISLNPTSVNDHKIFEHKWFEIEGLDFLSVIGGSRDFISWAAVNVLNIRGDSEATNSNYIILENIGETVKTVHGHQEVEENCKYYALQQDYSPFEVEGKKYSIQLRWGKIKDDYHNLNQLWNQTPSSKQFKLRYYENDLAAIKHMESTLNQKIKKGYYITKYTSNFPLSKWLLNHKTQITKSKFKQHSFNYTEED
jgi:8-oxo-dGTP pyrophosphatase MutT (NUDIX family)